MTQGNITANVTSQFQLVGVIHFTSYSEKVTNDSSKQLIFYMINNIITNLTMKQYISNVEQGSTHVAIICPCGDAASLLTVTFE